MIKGSSDKINVFCVPCWYPDPSGATPQKDVQIREHTKAALVYENINLIVLRTRVRESRNPGIRRYSSEGVGIIDIMPPSTGSRIFDLLSKTLLWQRGLTIALKAWGKPDVIHAQEFSSFHAVRSACALGIPSVVNQYWSGFHDRLADKSIKRRSRKAFNRAEVILYSSITGKTDLRNNRKLDFTPSVNCSATMLNDPRFHPFPPISVLDCRIPGQNRPVKQG